MNAPSPRFSICVPSYNRGAKALNLVQTLLPQIDDDWELLILDNASDAIHTQYASIAQLSEQHTNLRYVRHESNRLFQGNFLACFELAAADYFMLISDEDFANPDMIRQVLPILEQASNLGIYRGSIAATEGVAPRNAHRRNDQHLQAGAQALMGYSFSNNYVSGTIYNKRLAERHGLIERLTRNLARQRVYPHLYMDLLMASVGDVTNSSLIACFEGVEEITTGGDPVLGVCRGPMHYNPPYSFGSRVDQFIALRDGVREAIALTGETYNHTLFVNVYLRLCEKYFHLISNVNAPLYSNHAMNLPMLQESMLYVCGAAVSLYPELINADTQIFEAIQKIYLRYAKT